MLGTNVITNYANGTMIQLNANDALNFLEGLSITVINTVRDTIEEENKFGNKVKKSCDHEVMHLIEYYNSGVPEAIYSGILMTNANILLQFVRDIVLNETTRGLYLFYDSSNRRNGAAPYDLVIKALEDVHQYYMVHSDEYKRNQRNHFNRYNDEFIRLVNMECTHI